MYNQTSGSTGDSVGCGAPAPRAGKEKMMEVNTTEWNTINPNIMDFIAIIQVG